MLELSSVITNGYVGLDTIESMRKKGFTFVVTVPATLAHPHACENDKLSIFAKYTEPYADGEKEEGKICVLPE